MRRPNSPSGVVEKVPLAAASSFIYGLTTYASGLRLSDGYKLSLVYIIYISGIFGDKLFDFLNYFAVILILGNIH